MKQLMEVAILRTDGSRITRPAVPRKTAMREIESLLGADLLDTVNLRDGRVMFVDDNGIAKGKAINHAASELYRSVCRPGASGAQIFGDVAVAWDDDFRDDDEPSDGPLPVRAVPTLLAEARSAAREGSVSKAPTPYAVRCPTHGLTYLTAAEYDRQMRACDDVWVCPICDTRSIWDDATYEGAMEAMEDEMRRSRYVAPAEVHAITDPIDDGDDR